MVDTITLVVHEGNRRRYLLSVALHTLGATVAAAAFGAVLGALGGLLQAPWETAGIVVLVATAVLYLLREAASVPIPIPDRHRQVPEWWRRFYSPPVAALLYGLGLGIGFFTFLTYGTFVAVSVGAFVSGDPAIGALICGPFGLARGLSVVVGSLGAGGSDRLDDFAQTLWPRAFNALALTAVAAAGVWAIN